VHGHNVRGPSSPASKDKASADPNVIKVLTLTGCVKGESKDQLTLADSKNGTYHLSGTDLRRRGGRRVQVTGIWIGGLHIVGGLSPSPGGASHGTGPEPVLEFQVKKGQALKVVCP
jgi:hypothetical protein